MYNIYICIIYIYIYVYMYVYIYDYKFTLYKITLQFTKKKTRRNNITRSPDTNIPESTWEYKITNNNNKYIHLYMIFVSCKFLGRV